MEAENIKSEQTPTASNQQRRSTVWHDAQQWSLVPGTATDNHGDGSSSQLQAAATNAKELIRRTSSAVWDERPRTPTGWSMLLAAVTSVFVGYEMQLQQQLTCPPIVFLQDHAHGKKHKGSPTSKYQPSPSLVQLIYQQLTKNPDSILRQNIRPSLWVGTRGLIATSLAVVTGIPSNSDNHLRFKEIATMPMDGAQVALFWEASLDANNGNNPSSLQETLLKGPIDKPVVLILHGLNNDSSAGYIRSLQRTISNRGHIAVAMSFRGCNIPLVTPRAYNGSYTGDLRSVVHMIVGRLAPDKKVPLFLVGHSLGANIITKYLGEEGLSGTLHPCIAAGASLANPLEIHSRNNNHWPWKQLMAWGVKFDILSKWSFFRQIADMYPEFRPVLWGAMKALGIDKFDEATMSVQLRNDPFYPYGTHIGYETVEEYWEDCSSYRFIKHITVPLLQIIAGDDPVVYHSFQRKLTHSIMNPNVMSVETKCGGHLGWQESPPLNNNNKNSDKGDRPSWAGRATADFIDAVLEIQKRHASFPMKWTSSSHNNDGSTTPNGLDASVGDGRETRIPVVPEPVLRSRL